VHVNWRATSIGGPRWPDFVAVLEHDPDLGENLRDEDLARARMHIVADLVVYPRGDWGVGPDDFDAVANMGLLIIDGLMTRTVTVADYTCAELLGPGDVLQPWLRIGPDESVAAEVDWVIVQRARMAVLNRSFFARARHWPEISAAVSRRIMQRLHWLAFHLAVCGLRRVDDRVLLVLWHFADRWGTVTPGAVVLDIPVTHELLAAVIGARRPSVTVALGRLSELGRLRSRPRSRWLLLGQPPAELRTLHERTESPT
jgi:CRP/FNR family transcriptional regulator, cyclic AMP receptor protein